MKLIIFLLLVSTMICNAQNIDCIISIEGKIINKYNIALAGQAIKFQYKLFEGSNEPSKDTVLFADLDGKFILCLEKNPSKITIEISRTNFYSFIRKYELPGSLDLKVIELEEEEKLETPIPTDIITHTELNSSGQATVGRALHYISPAFNSTNQPISDGSAHFDPSDFKNLGSSRTLILVNGVRKNFSSYLQVNDVPNKGEVGVDLKNIPLAAIERVKIERQEATTIYGSDAIGGIIDFQLKKYTPELLINMKGGANIESVDGVNYGLDINKGFKFGERNFITITYSYLNQGDSNKSNSPSYDSLYLASTQPQWRKWVSENPSLGMRIGETNFLSNTIFYNSEMYFSNNSDDKFYSFGGTTYRQNKSYAIYRAPYWVQDPYKIFSDSIGNYNGFQPTFESDVRDNFFVFGITGRIVAEEKESQIEYDISQTVSNDDIDFSVNESYNPSIGTLSPTSFKVGGYSLVMSNSKLNFEWNNRDEIKLRFGGELRNERYIIKAGEENSYEGEGTISFPGIQPKNSLNANRNNFGAFTQFLYDVPSSDLAIDISGRYEKYYGFPDNFAWKLSGLYRLIDNNKWKIILRGNLSTGFRTPSLQQLYYSKIQTIVTGVNVSSRGTFNNESAIIRQLEVPKLQNETSNTSSLGISANWVTDFNKLTLSVDYYDIAIQDRIILSSSIDSARISDPNNVVRKLLRQNNISSLNFFINAVDTKTSGIDFNINDKYYLDSGSKEYFIEASASFNILFQNKITKPAFTPPPLEDAGIDIFDRKEQSRLLYSRPNAKGYISLNLEKRNSWNIAFSTHFFGNVKWWHPTDLDKDQVFKEKILLNLYTKFKINNSLSLSLNANNILNIYPDQLDPKGDPRTDVGGRFKYYREVNQFGYNGSSLFFQIIFSL